MLTMDQLNNQRVYVPRKARKADVPAKPKRYGRVHHVVFSPDGKTVVGLMVKRPDVAGMGKRNDVFCALDRLDTCDEGLIVQGDDAFDDKAAKRLGLDLDRCLIWGGMDARCEDGTELGYVTDVTFDFPSGAVDTVLVSDGSAGAAIVGSVPVPRDLVVGYRDGFMVVSNEARGLELTGGIAAKAGEGFGKAKQAGGEMVAKAGKAAGEAVDKGSFALGKAIGKAKRAITSAAEEKLEKSEEPPLYVPSGNVVKVPAPGEEVPAKEADKPTPSEPSRTDKAARAVGRQIGRAGGMFGAFMKEFKEASK